MCVQTCRAWGKDLCPQPAAPLMWKLLPLPQNPNSWQHVGKCDVCHPTPPPPFPSVNTSPELLREQGPDPCLPQKILQIGHRRCVPSVRQACTLIPGAPVFQDHASVSCRLFNEALWCGQWFGKLAKYKMQTKQEAKPAQLEGHCPRNRAATLQGAHSQLALHRNNTGHQGTWTNAPVSKWPTQGGKIRTQVSVILISLPGF